MAHQEPIKLTDVVKIGRNDSGYTFGVGLSSGRWIGFAAGRTSDGTCLFVMPEVAEGCVLGLPNRSEAIRLTSAIAVDPEHGFGGVDAWSVPESFRGDPEAYRCKLCSGVGCRGECQDDLDYDPEEDLY
jgi:hypothetical protein